MKKYFILSFLVLLSIANYSQTVLMQQEVKDTVLGKHGQNLRNFSHFYIGLGFIAGKPDSTGSDILYGKSTNLVVGYRYKFRICNFFAIGYDIDFNSYYYSLKQWAKKITPDTILHNKEKLTFYNLGISGYMRFNYGRRGNRIGNFIDLGGYGDWTFSAINFIKDKKTNGNIFKTSISHLKYYEAVNYGALARIGFNRYVFYGYYRLSDIFKSSYKYPELPRFTFGLQIGLYK